MENKILTGVEVDLDIQHQESQDVLVPEVESNQVQPQIVGNTENTEILEAQAWNNTEAPEKLEETASGDVTEQATNAGDERAADGGALRSKFNSRDGDATDIVSDLREASFGEGNTENIQEPIIEDKEPEIIPEPEVPEVPETPQEPIIEDKEPEIIPEPEVPEVPEKEPINLNVSISATITKPKIIDVNTKQDGTTGVKITGYDSKGKETKLSVIKNTDHDGFGVSGTNLSNGDTKELGKGEKIVVEFTDGKDVNSLDVSFAWRNNHETAKLTFIQDNKVVGYATVTGDGKSTTKAFVTYFDENGKQIGEPKLARGSSDKVDEAFTFELPNKDGGITSFDKVEFSAPSNVDDYLIHKISYKEVIEPQGTGAILTSDGTVTFNVQIDEKFITQDKLVAVVDIDGKEFRLNLNATGRGSVTLNASELKTDLSNINVKVKEIQGLDYDNISGNSSNFDFTKLQEKVSSNDDNIETTKDMSYKLSIQDFGNLSPDVKNIQITDLPKGKMFLTITTGETIFDKEGNKIISVSDERIEVQEGQILTIEQISSGKLSYISDEVGNDNFKFKVSDGNTFSPEYSTNIGVKEDILGRDIDLSKLKNIIEDGKIDLSNNKENKINLTLDDVLQLNDGKVKITGDKFDKVSFKNEDGKIWEKKTITEDNIMFDVYTNSGDLNVQVKVEQPISDGITC